MKRIIILFAILMASFLSASCEKLTVTDDIRFKEPYIIRETYADDEFSGLSWFCAFSDGKTVDDAVMFSFYFDRIDTVQPGNVLFPVKCMFGFVFSSSSDRFASEYDGVIKLKKKDKDHAVIHFDNVVFHVPSDFTINGDIRCPILDKYPWEE